MHITTIDVMSLNGKITKGGDSHAHNWSSEEDWRHFQAVVAKHNLLVMGSRTYDMVKPEPEQGRLRIVLTSRPSVYHDAAVPGQLEFVHATPERLVHMLEARGYTEMLLVGGQTNTSFFRAGLVNEMFVTVEPAIFGRGRDLLDDGALDAKLQLISVEKLNERGTLTLRYLVDTSGDVH